MKTLIYCIGILLSSTTASGHRHHHHHTSHLRVTGEPPSVGLGSALIPANRESFDNAPKLWNNDWALYKYAHPNEQDCSISESTNWKGA